MEGHYSKIIEIWLQNFINTMNSDVKEGFAEPGEDYGDVPKGIKIMFDGYAQDDIKRISFAVFIHKTSLTEYFPLHETQFNTIIHRQDEECVFYAWYIVDDNHIEVLSEDFGFTELKHDFVKKLIIKIHQRDPYIPG
jgi:hypothetical protein